MIDLSGLSAGSAGGNGGGGGGSIPAGAFVTPQYYNQNFGLLYKQVTTDGTTSEVTTQFLTAAPNEIPTVGTTTDPTTGDVTVTSLVGQQVKNALVIGNIMMVYDETNNAIKVVNRDGTTAANFYATGGVSALGYSPGGGGGGGGADLNALLDSINSSPIGSTAPGASEVGKCLIWTANGWAWGTTGSGGGGTVTSVATGTGLTGGPITGSGTISINSTYQTYISHGQTAYGWGNHAEAGYLTSSAIADMATKTWVNNQGFATQQWVNQQGFVKSSGVTSVGLSMPTGFSVNNSPITSSGTFSVSIASGYFLPTTSQRTTWNGKQDAISDLSTIRSNASHGESAYNSLGNYLLKEQGMKFLAQDIYIAARFITASGATDTDRAAYAQGDGYIEWWSSGGYFNHEMGFIRAKGNVTVGTGNTDTTHYLQIGGGRLFWDNTNNALYVQKADGTAAHFYATGGVSALGMSGGGTPSMNALTLATLNVTGTATINTLTVTNEVNTLQVNKLDVTNFLMMNGCDIYMDGGNISDIYDLGTSQFRVGSSGSTIKKIYWDGTYLQVQIGTKIYKFIPDQTSNA